MIRIAICDDNKSTLVQLEKYIDNGFRQYTTDISISSFDNGQLLLTANNREKFVKELEEKENKIKKVLKEELESYEHFKKESKKLIKKNGYDLEKNKLTAKIASSMGIKKEVNSDNSDASIAHMLTQGITMGVVDMETKIDNYKEVVNEDILSLAKEFLKFQQEEIEKLKEYM